MINIFTPKTIQRIDLDLIRHGKPMQDKIGRSLDELNPDGFPQMQFLKTKLISEYNKVIYLSSPLNRALKTAEHLSGKSDKIEIVECFRTLGVSQETLDHALVTPSGRKRSMKEAYDYISNIDNIPYGEENLYQAGERIADSINARLTAACYYTLIDYHNKKNLSDRCLILGISHAPVIEAGYVTLFSKWEQKQINFSNLPTLNPLQGIHVKADIYKNGNIKYFAKID